MSDRHIRCTNRCLPLGMTAVSPCAAAPTVGRRPPRRRGRAALRPCASSCEPEAQRRSRPGAQLVCPGACHWAPSWALSAWAPSWALSVWAPSSLAILAAAEAEAAGTASATEARQDPVVASPTEARQGPGTASATEACQGPGTASAKEVVPRRRSRRGRRLGRQRQQTTETPACGRILKSPRRRSMLVPLPPCPTAGG